MTLTIIYILILIQLPEGNNISTQLYLSVLLLFLVLGWVTDFKALILPSAWAESCWDCHTEDRDGMSPGMSPSSPWVTCRALGMAGGALCFTTELHTQMEKSQMEKSPGQTMARF